MGGGSVELIYIMLIFIVLFLYRVCHRMVLTREGISATFIHGHHPIHIPENPEKPNNLKSMPRNAIFLSLPIFYKKLIYWIIQYISF